MFSGGPSNNYTDLKNGDNFDNIELGSMAANDLNNVQDKFYEDIESIKEDANNVESLYAQLHESIETIKQIEDLDTSRELRVKMEIDLDQVLRLARVMKKKLEGLAWSNAASNAKPGGPGSLEPHKVSAMNALGKKLKEMNENFKELKWKMAAEYKETVEQKYYAMTGEKAEEEKIENLILSGEWENFMQKATLDEQRGSSLETIREIQERHDSAKNLEKKLIEFQQIFLQIGNLIEAQYKSAAAKKENQLRKVPTEKKSSSFQVPNGANYHSMPSNRAYIAIIAVLLILIILLIPIVRMESDEGIE